MLHIVIQDMKERITTLKELEDKHILALPFRGQRYLNWDQIVDFALKHPAYKVTIQSINADSYCLGFKDFFANTEESNPNLRSNPKKEGKRK